MVAKALAHIRAVKTTTRHTAKAVSLDIISAVCFWVPDLHLTPTSDKLHPSSFLDPLQNVSIFGRCRVFDRASET